MVTSRSGRTEIAVAEVGGKIYVVGGFRGERELEIYDPLPTRWGRGASLPRALHHAGAVGLNGKLCPRRLRRGLDANRRRTRIRPGERSLATACFNAHTLPNWNSVEASQAAPERANHVPAERPQYTLAMGGHDVRPVQT
jgi:hypothetical protein